MPANNNAFGTHQQRAPSPPPRRSTNDLSPRHWPSWAGVALLWLASRLPYRWQMRIGAGLGELVRLLAKRRVQIARTNLKLAFPDLDNRQRQTLLKRHFRSLGKSVMELGMSWWRIQQGFSGRVEISGMAHLDDAMAQGKGVLLYSAHVTAWEIGGSLLGELIDHPMSATFRPHENPVLDRVMTRGRQTHFVSMVPRDAVRDYLKELKAGHILWYAADQNFGHKGSVFAPFFGVLAATNTATSRLAKISGAPVVPFFPRRLADGSGYELVIEPALDGFPSGDPERDACRLNMHIENAVRRDPADYFWVHRRYKDRPDGEARFY